MHIGKLVALKAQQYTSNCIEGSAIYSLVCTYMYLGKLIVLK